MALSFVPLFDPKQVNNAAVDTLFTVSGSSANNIARNVRVRFANTTAAPATIKAWAIPSGETAVDENVCLPTVSINANDYIDVDIPVLQSLGFVQAQAGTATSITASFLDGFVQG